MDSACKSDDLNISKFHPILQQKRAMHLKQYAKNSFRDLKDFNLDTFKFQNA